MTKQKRLSIWYYDEDLDKEELKRMSRKYGHSMSQLVIQLIKSFLENEKELEKKKAK
ncbi:hypothetical protein BGP_3280 [Beggiatoa sp. PS]|nr:hypothetical protein BGP_3280 [Beggiatoa sp. PS]